MNGRRSLRRQRRLREVTKVEGDDSFDPALDGCRQYVPVLFLSLKAEESNTQALDGRFRESGRHFLSPVVRQLLRPGWIKLVHL